MKPPMLRSNPKLTFNSHEGEYREYNILQIIIIVSHMDLLQTMFENIERYLKFEFKSSSEFTAAEIKRVLNDDT